MCYLPSAPNRQPHPTPASKKQTPTGVWAGITSPSRPSASSDAEDGSLPLTALRLITIRGMVSVQVTAFRVGRLVTMVRPGTVFSHAAFRYVVRAIGAIAAAALVRFAVTIVGVTVLGVALIVLVLRMLLAQAVARDVEAAQLQAELDEVIRCRSPSTSM